MKKKILKATILLFISLTTTAQITFEKQLQYYDTAGYYHYNIDTTGLYHAPDVPLLWFGEDGVNLKQTNDSGFIIMGIRYKYDKTFNGNTWHRKQEVVVNKTDKDGNVQWSKNYGTVFGETSAISDGSILGRAEITPTNDGGYVMVGSNDVGFSYDGGNKGFIIKTDNTGNLQWAKEFGGQGSTRFISAQETINGEYIVLGATSDFSSGYVDWNITLIKLNTLGSVLWSRIIGDNELSEFPQRVKQDKDGGFIICGENQHPSAPSNQSTAFLLKTDSVGIVKWARTYGVRDMDVYIPQVGYDIQGNFNSVEPTSDGGYIATGNGNGWDGRGAWVVKTDYKGTLQWSKGYVPHDTSSSNVSYSSGLNIFQTSEGGYLLNAQSNWKGTSVSQYYFSSYYNQLIKLDTEGVLSWSRFYGGRTETLALLGFSVLSPTNDNGFVLSGGKSNLTLYKIDSIGKNNDCQNNIVAVYIIPTVTTDDYFVTTASGLAVQDVFLTPTSFSVSAISACSKMAVDANFEAETSCVGSIAYFTNQSSGYDFNWNFGDSTSGVNNTSSLFAPMHRFSSVGNHTVTLIVSESGSIDTIRKVVNVVSNKFVSVGDDITICSGDSTLLSASGSFSFFGFKDWTPHTNVPNFFLNPAYAYPDTTILYVATAFNGSCFDTDSLTITVLPIPTISTTGDITICQGSMATLSASGNNEYLWSTGATTTTISINLNTSTTLTVSTFNGGCYASKALIITVLPSYTVEAGFNVTISKGSSAKLNGTTLGGVSWIPTIGVDCPTCSNTKVTPPVTTKYYLQSSTTNGCVNIDSVTVYVLDCDAEVVIPNAFSPNGDGHNDVLQLTGNECLTNITFTIYDRWGNKVFESEGLNKSWNGIYKGKLMDATVVVYSLSAETASGDLISKKGNISLIR